MSIATIVISVLLAVAFLFTAAIKLFGVRQSLQIRDQLGVGAGLWRVIGGLEVAGAVGLLVGLEVPALGLAAAVGLSLLMVGAIGAHARAGDLRNAVPAVVCLGLAVAVAVLQTGSL